MATHSSILAWKIPLTEQPGELQSMGLQKSQAELSTHVFIYNLININIDFIFLN